MVRITSILDKLSYVTYSPRWTYWKFFYSGNKSYQYIWNMRTVLLKLHHVSFWFVHSESFAQSIINYCSCNKYFWVPSSWVPFFQNNSKFVNSSILISIISCFRFSSSIPIVLRIPKSNQSTQHSRSRLRTHFGKKYNAESWVATVSRQLLRCNSIATGRVSWPAFWHWLLVRIIEHSSCP